jgi:hypothetical protein
MDFEKYNMIPEEYKTAREIGLAAATLGALARRGLVEIQDGSPKKYRKVNNSTAQIYALCEENKNDYDTYFTLRKSTEKLGMLCSISNNTIVDCWGKPYDLTNVNKVEFRTKVFNI